MLNTTFNTSNTSTASNNTHAKNTSHSMKTFQSQLIDCLIGCAIGDAFGAGHEMRSREQLLEQIPLIRSRYQSRDPKFSKGFTPGDYTDDFEMTLAVLFALKSNNWELSEENLYQQYNQLYFETINKFGTERAGYGSISKLLKTWQNKGYDEFKKELLNSMLVMKTSETGNDAPGNASLMRICPIIFSDKLIDNALINAMSTRPHGYTIFSSVILALAGKYLVVNEGDPLDVIRFAINEFNSNREYILQFVSKHRDTVLMQLSDEHKEEKEFLDVSKLNHQFDTMITKLQEIDVMQMPKDPDVIYGEDSMYNGVVCGKDEQDSVDGINYFKLAFPYASPLKSGTGLGAKCEQTLYCAMFCLKWNRATSLFGNLLRVVLFGGDTDTLAACVLPYIYTWHNEHNTNNLPKWIYDGLEMYDSKEKKYGFDYTIFEQLVK